MNRYEVTVERLMDPDSRRKSIERLPKAIKCSWVASVLFMVGAIMSFFGPQPALGGLLMGVAAINLAVGANNANALVLALYVDKTEKKANSEQGASSHAATQRP